MVQPSGIYLYPNAFSSTGTAGTSRISGRLHSHSADITNPRRHSAFVGILSVMLLSLAVAYLAGCTGLSSPKASTTPSSPTHVSTSAGALRIATNALPTGAVQSSYGATLIAIGGVPPYSWSQTSGQLPNGLTINSATGTIAGTATSAGTYTFIARVQDSKSNSASAGFSLKCSPVSSVSKSAAPAIVITGPTGGAPVSGNISVSADATDPQHAIASVQFFLGGSSLGPTLTSSPYAVIWDTSQVADGDHNLSATAFDVAGNATTQASITVAVKNTSWNPAVLGVSWASDFVSIAGNEIDVKMDSRLKIKAAGDGSTDDTNAIRSAIKLASSSGGGVVYFPSGDYKISAPSNSVRGTPLQIPSRVILRGSSSQTTRILVYDPNTTDQTDGTWTWGGLDFQGSSQSGMTDLGVYAVNSSTSPCALLWNRGSSKVSELFFNNLDVHLDNCKSFWFEGTDRLLVQGSQFDSNYTQRGPIYIIGTSHVSFINNKITYRYGRVQLQNNTDLLMQGNTLVRDADNKDMDEGTAIESGGVELSFGQNVQVLNNTIQTLNAPPSEAGDGEAIMSQQSNTKNVLDAGSSTAITSTTLTDTKALWGSVTSSRMAMYPEVVAILSGSATGEWRVINGININTKTLTLSQPWSPVPEVGSLYSIFTWTLSQANIQGNTLLDNPNGIVLYDGCYGCKVQNNVLTNSRQIILRSVDASLDPALYPEGRRVHQVAIGNEIINNTVSDTSGVRPAYIALDVEAFYKNNYSGMGMLNIQVAGNTIIPFSGNPNQIYPNPRQNEITQEGLFPCFLYGPAAVNSQITTIFKNITSENNSQSVPVTYKGNFSVLATQACLAGAAH